MEAPDLKGKSIVSFALERWDDVWRNRHHLMSRLAHQNNVLFVTRPFYVWHAVHELRIKNSKSTGLSKIAPGLHAYVPPRWLPYNYRFPKLNRWMEEKRIARVRKEMGHLGMKDPILYLWHPEFVDMVGCFDESLVIYHCYDEYTTFIDCEGAELEILKEQEHRLLQKADIVFTSSKDLGERKRIHNANTHIIRNAVDYSLFATAANSDTRVPDDLLAIPRPIIGCVAATGHYIDAETLHGVFSRRPEWSFVFVGDLREDTAQWNALRALPNTYFTGQQPFNELPRYLKGTDVCLMPYLMTDKILVADSPLKLYEYLATGKPVVSVRLPSISHLDDVVRFASDVAGWDAAIQSALNENSPDIVEKRKELARQNTWDHRAAQVSQLIAHELQNQTNGSRFVRQS